MTEEQQALARRAVACKAWKWRAGMLIYNAHDTEFNDRICYVQDELVECRDNEILGDDILDWLPDLTDPATLGCLLALVREVWGPRKSTEHNGWKWQFGTLMRYGELRRFSSHLFAVDYTEAGALVAALETAP